MIRNHIPDFQERVERLNRDIPLSHGSAFVTVNPSDIEYLTGLPSSPGCLLVGVQGEPVLFMDEARWNGAVAFEPRASMQRFRADESPAKLVADFCAEQQISRLVCEDLPVSFWEAVGGANSLAVERRPGVLSSLRRRKNAREQGLLRRAALLADHCMEVGRAAIHVGATELQVAAEVERYLRLEGGEGTWFPTVVSSGHRSSHPVYPATRKVIERGDMVVVDIGLKLDGYCADITRTFVVGGASERQLQLLRAVLEGQQQALAAVGPGVPVADVDLAARRVFEAQGLSQYVTHAVGHGLGLAKEAPTLAPGIEDHLVPGDCVTVEPGLYIPGIAGARIEDEVLVSESGAEIITHFTKALTALILP